MTDLKEQEYNPLLEINTSFQDYLDAHTRTYTEHIISGKMDYAFDGDFSMRTKINAVQGWAKLYKTISATDVPNHFKKLFRSADTASSMNFANAYRAVNKCSERLQLTPPSVMVKKAKELPEIYSISGDGTQPAIVMSSDVAEMCSEQELLYLIGCELGRIQNKHTVYNYAFTYPGIIRGYNGDGASTETGSLHQLNYALNAWLKAADLTVDRAGIICLDNPADFPQIYASVRHKLIPDSFGNINDTIDIAEVMELYNRVHITPVREIRLDDSCSPDCRRIIAGLEFIGCEVLYSWRNDLDSSGLQLTTKQSLEIRCDIFADAERYNA